MEKQEEFEKTIAEMIKSKEERIDEMKKKHEELKFNETKEINSQLEAKVFIYFEKFNSKYIASTTSYGT